MTAAQPVKIAIGIPGGELARYAIFYDSLMSVHRPANTVHIQGRGANVAENRNGIAERALAQDCTHLFYVDDDQVFAPDTLMRLLDRDKDIVSGLYLSREAPFTPQMYNWEDDQSFVKPKLLEPFAGGLQSCVATGAGCLLIRTDVFRKLAKPWWTLGQIIPDGWCDDVDFCRRARAAGYAIWCDQDVLVGHNLWMTAWPQRQEDGAWMTILVGANGQPLVQFPAAQPKRSLVSI
jgi:GT2 family glycosyltransferase